MPTAKLTRTAQHTPPDPAGVARAARAPRLALAQVGAVNERARKRLVAVVLVIYLLAIFEGSLRKYVAPQLGQYIFFIRDPFLIYAYVLATRFGLWPRNSGFFKLSVCMCVFGVALFGLQIALHGFSDTRMILGVNGWRSYFLYVPLAFLIGAQFNRNDLTRFAKITLLLAVPIAVLVSLQFISPMNSPINVGIAEEKELQFKGMGLDANHIRATGPFTSTAGLQQFVVTACGFALAWVLLPASQRRFGISPLLAAVGAILTCVAFSGSRGTLVQCVLMGAVAVFIGLIGRGQALKAKALTLPLSLGAAAAMLYPIVFPTGFAAFMNRWNSAAINESHIEAGLFGRALYGFIDFFRLFDVAPLFGFGLGYGSNASIQLRATVDGVRPGDYVETDFARHMVDLGPLFGVGYIVFRLALVVWLSRRVLLATRSVSDPLPMMLLGYAGYTLLLGQISGNGSINVYGWLFTGLCIAATDVALRSVRPQGAAGLIARRGALQRGRMLRIRPASGHRSMAAPPHFPP
jgi:hypothetical protein